MEFITGNTIDIGSLKLIHPDGSETVVNESETFDFNEPLNSIIDKLVLINGENAADWIVWNTGSKIYLVSKYALGKQTFNLGGSISTGSGSMTDANNNKEEYSWEDPHYEKISQNILAMWPEFDVDGLKGRFILLPASELMAMPVEVANKLQKDDFMLTNTLGDIEELSVSFGSVYHKRHTLKCISWNGEKWSETNSVLGAPVGVLANGEEKYKYRPIIELTAIPPSISGKDEHLGIKTEEFSINYVITEFGSSNSVDIDIEFNNVIVETMSNVDITKNQLFTVTQEMIDNSNYNKNTLKIIVKTENGISTRIYTFNKINIANGEIVKIGRITVADDFGMTRYCNTPVSKNSIPVINANGIIFNFTEEYSEEPKGTYKFDEATEKLYSWVAWNNPKDNELYLVGTTPIIRNLGVLADSSEGIVNVVNKISSFELSLSSINDKENNHFVIPDSTFFRDKTYVPMDVWNKIDTFGTYVVSKDNNNEVNSTYCFSYSNEEFDKKVASELDSEDISFLPIIKIDGLLPPIILSDMPENLGNINKPYKLKYKVISFSKKTLNVTEKLNGSAIRAEKIGPASLTELEFNITSDIINSLKLDNKNIIEIIVDDGSYNITKTFSFIKTNTVPSVTADPAPGSLGEVSRLIDITYTPYDADGDELYVTVKLNDTILDNFKTKSYTARKILIPLEELQKLDSGDRNKIVLEVSDGKDKSTSEWVFSRGNYPPEIIDDGKNDLGDLLEIPIIAYIIKDIDKEKITVTESLNGQVIRKFETSNNLSNTVLITPEIWENCNRTNNTITVEARDDNGNTARKLYTFNKINNRIDVESKNPVLIQNPDAKVKIDVNWSNYGGTLIVLVCNNGYDDNPVWEDMTEYSIRNKVYTLTNTNKAASKWGLKFRVIIDRNEGYDGKVFLYEFIARYEE